MIYMTKLNLLEERVTGIDGQTLITEPKTPELEIKPVETYRAEVESIERSDSYNYCSDQD